MNISSQTQYFIFNIDGTCRIVNIDEYIRTDSEVKGKLKICITTFNFDLLKVYFSNGKLIACAVGVRKMSGYQYVGYRVSANAADFGNFNGLVWRQLGLIHFKTLDREELNKYAYGEIAKIAMERMDRMFLGKDR